MNKKLTILGTLLMAVAVTGYSVSGTYAKYAGETTVLTDTSRVAVFKVAADNEELKLFTTSTATGTMTDGQTVVLKPGAEYSVDVEIKDVVETEVDYDLSFTLEGSDFASSYKPMRYAIELKDAPITNWYTFAELQEALTDGSKELAEGSTYTVYAKWSQDLQELGFEDDDQLNAADMELAAGTETTTVTLKAHVTQKSEQNVTVR